jgi:hypothetical protein
MIHLKFGGANFWAKLASKVKIIRKLLALLIEAENFTNKVKFLTPTNN